MKKVLLFFICATLCVAKGSAQEKDSLKVLDAMYHDFSIPDASSFSLLGINPSKISKPSSTKELAASLVNVASGGTSISPGIALEWAPMQTFDKRFISRKDSNIIYKNYEHYKSTFFARNLQLSFATVKDSTGSKVAAGLNFVIFDQSDPSNDQSYADSILALSYKGLVDISAENQIRYDFGNLMKKSYESLGLGPKQDPDFYSKHNPLTTELFDVDIKLDKDSLRRIFIKKLDLKTDDKKDEKRLKEVDHLIDEFLSARNGYRADTDKDAATVKKILKDVTEKYKKEHWNAGMLKFGLGKIWNSTANTWKGLQSDQFTTYGVWTGPFGHWGQGIVLAQYNYYNTVTDSLKSAFVFGGRMLAGSPNIHGSVELVYQANTYRMVNDHPVMNNSNTLRSTVGLEFKMNEGLWLEFAVGISGPSTDFFKNAGLLSLANVKYTFKKEPRYKMD